MNLQKAKKIANYIFENVFEVENLYGLKRLKSKFAIDIPLSRKTTCSLSGDETWIFASNQEKIASQKAIAQRFKKDEWMRKEKNINSLKDILEAWAEINYITGEKYINSKDITQSDGIYNSISVYQSASVFDSKNILFSYKIFDSNYMLASRDSTSCTLGIRVTESIFCSSGFEISWSNKVSKSMYIHDCFDLYECLFCSHLRSKKYCIANMQFDKEEYFKLKKFVIDWILKE